MNISIIGTGYVGLVSGACFASLGHHVVCVDVDQEKVNKINNSVSPIYEKGLNELLQEYQQNIEATTSYEKAVQNSNITFICVGTPSLESGDIDLSYVDQATKAVASELKKKDSFHSVIVKSTVVPGTTEHHVISLLETVSGKKAGKDFGVGMNPEFLREGVAVDDFLHPDRVVYGYVDERTRKLLAELYKDFSCPIVETSVTAAEMIKYASNCFLAAKISFINEIGNFCKHLGIDVYDVADGMGLDSRIERSFLNAGIGWGGSCLKGQEFVFVRYKNDCSFIRLEKLFEKFSNSNEEISKPEYLEVLSWNSRKNHFDFKNVNVITKRKYSGKIITIHTSMRKFVSVTDDHPMLLVENGQPKTRLARDIREGDRLPVLTDIPSQKVEYLNIIEVIKDADDFPNNRVYLKPQGFSLKQYKSEINKILKDIRYDKNYSYSKSFDLIRGNYLPLDLFLKIEKRLPFNKKDLGIYTSTGLTTVIPSVLKLDKDFWRFIGYYISEGHVNSDGSGHGKKDRKRIMISFNYQGEEEYVNDVEKYLTKLGIKFKTYNKKTSTQIQFSSRVFAYLLEKHLGCGKDSYTAKLPDLIYTQSEKSKLALLSGLFRGDGHIAYPRHTNAIVYDYGSISEELIKGMQFLLHSLNIVPSYKTSISSKSSAYAHFLRVSSRDQVNRLKEIFLKKDRDKINQKLSEYSKKIKPTGHKKENGRTTVKVRRTENKSENTYVYSLEVEDNHNFVTTDGLIVHNCFPKDTKALRAWADKEGISNEMISGTIKTNESQPLQLINILKKHIPDLKDKTVGVLGLAFKPDTDDIRDSRSIPLVDTLVKEGVTVKAYDPKAMDNFKKLFSDILYCDTAKDVLDVDAVIIATAWEEFERLDFSGKLVIDGRRMLKIKESAKNYEGVCW